MLAGPVLLGHGPTDSIRLRPSYARARAGLRAPEGAFGLFAARRRAADPASSPSSRAAHGFPALGLTDTNNLFGALEFSDKLADAGIQPIVGVHAQRRFRRAPQPRRPCERTGANSRARRPATAPIALLAMNEAGYANLMKLVRRALLRSRPTDEPPHIEIERARSASATASSRSPAAPTGPIDRPCARGSTSWPSRASRRWRRSSATGSTSRSSATASRREIEVEPQLLELAYARALPIVATNEVYFATPDDYEAHDALLCIAEGALRRRGQPAPRCRASTIFKSAEADGGAVRRPARGARQHHRDRQALRLPPQGPQADPAALRRRRRRGRARPSSRAGGGRAEAPGRGRA